MENSGLTSRPSQTAAAGRTENARTENTTEAEALAKLDDLKSSLSHMRDLKEGLRKILAAIIELLGAGKGNIQLYDAEQGVLTIEVQQGFEESFLDSFKRISTVDDTACGRALRLRRPVVIEDTETDAGYVRYRAAARSAGYRAVISTPIMPGQIMASQLLPLGMISVHFASPHQATEQDQRLMPLYMRLAADVIQKYATIDN